MRKTMQIRLMTMAAALICTFSTARAAEPPVGSKELYLKYCSACHGESGKGDGVVSGYMTPRPVDLTQFTKKAGGAFPFMLVMQGIDGTKTVRAHGNSDMPVWGEAFLKEMPAESLSARERLRGRLMLITEYIAAIQAQ